LLLLLLLLLLLPLLRGEDGGEEVGGAIFIEDREIKMNAKIFSHLF